MANVENLIIEHLKALRAGQDRIETDVRELTHRVGRVEIGIAGLRRDLSHYEEGTAEQSVRMDRLNERIERVERRLEIAE